MPAIAKVRGYARVPATRPQCEFDCEWLIRCFNQWHASRHRWFWDGVGASACW